MSNPFSRKPKSPIDRAFAAADEIRADAAEIAGTIRDAAARAAEVLDEAAPRPVGRRLPLIGAALAAAGAVLLLARRRSGGGSHELSQDPPSVHTAASATATESDTEISPASAGEVEEPRDAKATTRESDAASG